MGAATVFAPAAGAAGRAALAVVRASGPGAGPALRALLRAPAASPGAGPSSSGALRLPPPRRLALRELRCPRTGEVLDRACVAWLPGPRTYTGEDSFELYLHGGRAVLQGVLGALGSLEGLRPAEPGEFARRAFLAGKVGLTELEGLADLLAAETAAQRRHALALEGGAATRALARWRVALVRARAQLEARLDFSDEDLGDGEGVSGASGALSWDPSWGSSRSEAEVVLREVREAADDGGRAAALVGGLGILLAGRPNAGKSSLLNALSGTEAAIVHAEAGTTRDVLHVPVDLGGFKCVLTDTAGLRAGGEVGEVEAEGVRRAQLEGQKAHVRVFVLDAASPELFERSKAGSGLRYRPGTLGRAAAELSKGFLVGEVLPDRALEAHRTIFALNKGDLLTDALRRELEAAAAAELGRSGQKSVLLSCLTGAGTEALLQELTESASSWFEEDGAGEGACSAAGGPAPPNAVSLFHRERQRRRLAECAERLEAALESEAGLEVAAEELRLAVDALGRVAGIVDPEEVLGAIFAEFCIGK